MKALVWHGKGDIRCDSVADPSIEDARDVIVKVSACAICGSDLHLMDGQMPTMERGDVLGHEFMGEVVEVGATNHKLKKGPLTSTAVNAVNVRWAIGRHANGPIATPKWQRRSLVTPQPACSAIPTLPVVTGVGRPSMFGSRWLTWVP